ncbi:MAG TPA: sigma 54-interacting transcriptional regulator, partial [Bacteroidota bacterium]
MRSRVLALDGERDVLALLVQFLESSGFDVETAADGAGGFQKILDRKFDVIVADLAILEVKDFEFLKGVVTVSPSTGIIALVTREKVHQALKVLRHGVFDYLIKPVGFDEILLRLKRLREYTQLTAETRRLRKEVHREYGFENIVGGSESMGKTLQTVRQVTSTSDPVLLTGRSGTGKELVARVIHFNGPRRDKPFIVVNCCAFVESLFESALFGHTDGSFAQTLPETEGLFEAAEGGTLFLDEVSEVPLHLQARLFHAMEGKESAPDRLAKCTDVRLIAATNKDLRSAVESGLFQEGLYRRLIANEIRLPSLSERIEDIPALADHFVEKY